MTFYVHIKVRYNLQNFLGDDNHELKKKLSIVLTLQYFL